MVLVDDEVDGCLGLGSSAHTLEGLVATLGVSQGEVLEGVFAGGLRG